MMTRGREVIRGKLWTPKGKSNKKQRAEVVVYCAPHDCQTAGRMEIFEESFKNYQKPKRVIPLTDIREQGLQEGPPFSYYSSSPAQNSPRNSFLSSSPSSSSLSSTPTQSMLFPFHVHLKSGETLDFYTPSPEDQRQWMKRLGLLLMFPYSPIPEEPSHNPIKDGFRKRLNPKDHKADSVWPVYILAEEVGTRVHALGVNVIALRSRKSDTQPGQLDIISPTDPTPIVTWDRDKMRRTGCLGNMVFIEIGRRCIGGPGLVWMFAGPADSAALRETLHSFLFKGDGRAVAIQAQPHAPETSHPRASFDRSLPPSYSRRASCDSYQTQIISTPRRQHSTDSQGESDSGHPPSPLSTSISPPPVDMKSHPNRRRSSGTASLRRSSPRDIAYENMELDSGARDMSNSVDSSLGEIFDMDNGSFDERQSSYMDEELATGSMEASDRDMSRHPTIPSSQPRRIKVATHRSNSTATCKPSQRAQEYIEMMHPRAGLIKDNYILMQPVGPVQLDGGSPPRSLSPITESESKTRTFAPTSYENHRLPAEVASQKFVTYQTPYENVQQSEGGFAISADKSRRDGRPIKYVEVSSGERFSNSPSPVMVEMPPVS